MLPRMRRVRAVSASAGRGMGWFVSFTERDCREARSEQACGHVDGQRDQRGVEEKGQHAVHSAGSSNFSAGKTDIGRLCRGADHDGEIQKVTVIRRLVARKTQ